MSYQTHLNQNLVIFGNVIDKAARHMVLGRVGPILEAPELPARALNRPRNGLAGPWLILIGPRSI
jgi:hypothetical protein